ncbi:MAG: LanC-like protein [Polyangiaceae bacterium]
MRRLYPPEKHCELRGEDWSAARARAAVVEILRHSVECFDAEGLWPRHPLDGDDPPRTDFYRGAGGVFWGVSHLSREGWTGEPEGWFGRELLALVERNVVEQADFDLDASRSYLLGDIPLLMLLYTHQPRALLAERIFSRLEGALLGPVYELMWGIPGCMLATLHMHRATAQDRWIHLYQRQASRLLAAGQRVPGVGYHWVSERRGKSFDGLGAVHGLAGNVTALLRGFSFLSAEQQALILAEVPDTLVATAVRDSGRANWPRSTGSNFPWRVHHCHGAPGIVTSLASFPVGVSSALDSLLLEAGELIHDAGAVRKGPSLCHGTAGNGFALLSLYVRTGEGRWLERAQRFAMHALWQVERGRELFSQGRHSLWTGDLGVAIFLNECLRETARFPTVDVF